MVVTLPRHGGQSIEVSFLVCSQRCRFELPVKLSTGDSHNSGATAHTTSLWTTWD
jgi:hypothetical protein